MKINTTTLLVIICALISNLSISQNKLTIIYKRGSIANTAKEYIDTTKEIEWAGHYWLEEFTINDSTTYNYCFKQGENNNSFFSRISNSYSKLPLGSQFFSHSNYCDYRKGIVVYEAKNKNKELLIIDSIRKENNWTYGEEVKTILGHRCKSAMLIKDSAIACIAWFTDELNCDFSIDGTLHLPGIILEIYYPKIGWLLSATEIKKEAKSIVFPAKGYLITCNEAKKMYNCKICCDLSTR
jgi:GLPGLI family protein